MSDIRSPLDGITIIDRQGENILSKHWGCNLAIELDVWKNYYDETEHNLTKTLSRKIEERYLSGMERRVQVYNAATGYRWW